MAHWLRRSVGLGILFGACSAAIAQDSAPAAVVNGTPISRAELDGAFRQSRISDQAARMPPDEVNKIKLRILNLLINRTVLNQFLAEQKVKVDEKHVADHVRQVERRLSSSGQTLVDFLKKLGVTEEQMRADIRNDYRWVAFVESQAKESVLRKYFEANKSAFDGSEIHARHILIKANETATPDQKELARRRAEDLRAQIKAGQPFDVVARQHSECPSREKGGELPWFPRKGVMSESFAAAAFGLKDGELSQVVESEFGCHLIVVMERKVGPKPVTFEEVVDDVKTWYAEDLRRAEVARLRQQAKIEVMFP